RHTRSKRDWSSDVCSSDLACSRKSSKSSFKLSSAFLTLLTSISSSLSDSSSSDASFTRSSLSFSDLSFSSSSFSIFSRASSFTSILSQDCLGSVQLFLISQIIQRCYHRMLYKIPLPLLLMFQDLFHRLRLSQRRHPNFLLYSLHHLRTSLLILPQFVQCYCLMLLF